MLHIMGHPTFQTIKGKNGFTFVELMAVVAILATISVFSVPVLASTVSESKEVACRTNRITIERTLMAYQIDHPDATLQAVLDGEISDFPLDKPEISCPSGGVYSVRGTHIVCSTHNEED